MEKDRTPHWLGQLVLGVGLGSLAIGADAVDFKQNIDFGLESNQLAAITYGLAAVGVLVIPAAAERVGWSWLLRGVAFASLLLTFVAALNFHANSEGRRISHGQDKADTYVTAKAEADDARQKLAKLPDEPLNAEALQKLVEAAKAEAIDAASENSALAKAAKAQEATDTQRMGGEPSCFGKCKKAQQARDEAVKEANTKRDALVARLGVVNRRAELEAKVAAAKTEAKDGPEMPSGLAVMIADTSFAKSQGWTAAGVAWTLAEVMMIARICLTMAFASLGGYAVRLVADGWAARPWRKAPVKVARTKPTAQTGGAPSPRPGKRTPRATAEPAKGADVISLHAAQKAAARQTVAQLLASGLSQREVSRRTGIAKSTVSSWAKAAKAANSGQVAPAQIAANG